MPEVLTNKQIKAIAFYLPQFHSIPENDRAWGKGFTEWTNMKKAKPLFNGHNQPRIPLHNNYYNLLDTDVQIWQAELAMKYGVYGFCYYHYWFKNGKKLLEKPLENMLQDKRIKIPFCISWANENWSKRWDGGNHELIAEQDYGSKEDWEKHFLYLYDFFKDERYITLNGKPILLIYKPGEIPCLTEMLDYFNSLAKEKGLKGICYMIQNPTYYFGYDFEWGQFDYLVNFEPFFTYDYMRLGPTKTKLKHMVYRTAKHMGFQKYLLALLKKKRTNGDVQLETWDYDVFWKNIIERKTEKKMISGAFVDWDNTPRKANGKVFVGVSPEKFGKYISCLVNKIKANKQTPIVFINAWNEWCEGAYLEPDERNQYQNLEELNKALKE